MIFTACFYAKSPNNNDVRNVNVLVVTESFDHDRVASRSCLQKVVQKMEHMHEKIYKNFYVWSAGVGHNLDLDIYSCHYPVKAQ